MIHIHSGILLSYKRNTFESVLTRQMNLKPVIQTEVSQEVKDKCCILMHIYMEFRKMVLMNLFAGQQWRSRYREPACGHSSGRRVGQTERVALKHIHYHV